MESFLRREYNMLNSTTCVHLRVTRVTHAKIPNPNLYPKPWTGIALISGQWPLWSITVHNLIKCDFMGCPHLTMQFAPTQAILIWYNFSLCRFILYILYAYIKERLPSHLEQKVSSHGSTCMQGVCSAVWNILFMRVTLFSWSQTSNITFNEGVNPRGYICFVEERIILFA